MGSLSRVGQKSEVSAVKQCGWCLYLGETRVYDVRALRQHFDTALVSGYLLGGMLERWLADAGEDEILSRVRAIDYAADVGAQLEFIFGVRPERKTRLPACLTKKRPPCAPCPLSSSFFGAGFASNSSFYGGSYRLGSYRAGSYRIGSYRLGSGQGSYRIGSFRHEFEFEFARGSFRGGSFRLTSFGKSGSFALGSFRGGSYRFYAGNAEITEEEYHRTLINLSSCPLNEYGYGVHLI